MHIVILDYDLQKEIEKVVGQWSRVNGNDQKFCTETLKNFFSNAKKRASRNIFRHFFHANFFMFVLLISDHTVFLVQFEINLHEWVFQKPETAFNFSNFSFLKNSLVQINSKLNSKPYDYLYLSCFVRFCNAVLL